MALYPNYGTPTFNPLISAQNRLMQMENMYPQFAGNQPYQMPNIQQQGFQANFPAVSQPVINSIAVTGEAEARSAQIPFNNDINLYVDIANNCIYIKTFNMNNGSSDFRIFSELKKDNLNQLNSQQNQVYDVPSQLQTGYVTVEDFNSLKSEFEALKESVKPTTQTKQNNTSKGSAEK